MFFWGGGGYFELMDFLNGTSHGKIFDFIIEDFHFCMFANWKAYLFFFFCECVCVLRDCKILFVELGSGAILIPVWYVLTFTRFGKGRATFFFPNCGVCTEDLYSFVQKGAWLLHTHTRVNCESCSYFSRCPNALIYWPGFSTCLLRCRKMFLFFSFDLWNINDVPSTSRMRPELRLTADLFKEFFSQPLLFFSS